MRKLQFLIKKITRSCIGAIFFKIVPKHDPKILNFCAHWLHNLLNLMGCGPWIGDIHVITYGNESRGKK